MEILQQILPFVLPLVASGVLLLVGFVIRKTHLADGLKDQLEALTKRVVDKAHQLVGIAIAPDSEGGVKITSAEASVIRNAVWLMAKDEIKGPFGKLLLTFGEQWAKGIIGIALKKLGIDVGPKS